MSLVDTTVFLNQRVVLPGGSMARLRVGGIFNQEGRHVRSAYIDDETKIVFRSESARAYVFVEISQEMWQFEEDGSMLREKCQVFLHELFAHWTGRMGKGIDVKSKGNATSHTVSIILYGRVIYEDNGEGEEERAPLRRLEDGTLYRDFYKVSLKLTGNLLCIWSDIFFYPGHSRSDTVAIALDCAHGCSRNFKLARIGPHSTSTVWGAETGRTNRVRPRITGTRSNKSCTELFRGALGGSRSATNRSRNHRPDSRHFILRAPEKFVTTHHRTDAVSWHRT